MKYGFDYIYLQGIQTTCDVSRLIPIFPNMYFLIIQFIKINKLDKDKSKRVKKRLSQDHIFSC